MKEKHAPSDLGPSSPEQQEWQGQKWEYLVASCLGDFDSIYIMRRVGYGLFGKGANQDAIVEEYNNKINQIDKEHKGASVQDGINLLGQDGWELAVGVNEYSMNGVGLPILVFKRPINKS